MAMKKIRLDFSKVEERSGWNTRAIPEGLHKMKIESVQMTEAGDGTDMLVYALKPVDGRYKSRLFPFYCKLQQNQYWKFRDLLVAAGVKVPKSVYSGDPSAIVGKYIAAEVEDESNAQYAGRSVINGTYGLDILDEDGDDNAPDEEDEEYEGDEDEAEEAEDDEEEDDEEEDEDLSLLTLPALRKMAKELGIDHTGLKKDELIEAIEEGEAEEDEDEDDLDDEDLEDDDLEDEEFEDDEEEEEAPTPKRRPAAKPAARKPAAKAAAPTRRPIRRR